MHWRSDYSRKWTIGKKTLAEANLRATVRHGGGGTVMLWDAIWYRSCSLLVGMHDYVKKMILSFSSNGGSSPRWTICVPRRRKLYRSHCWYCPRLLEGWRHIPMTDINYLNLSIPCRIQTIVQGHQHILAFFYKEMRKTVIIEYDTVDYKNDTIDYKNDENLLYL